MQSEVRLQRAFNREIYKYPGRAQGAFTML